MTRRGDMVIGRRKRKQAELFIASLLLSAVLTACTTNRPAATVADVSVLHRLYDMTPVSATNPVVARAKDCGIEIPVSELRAYVDAMPDTMPNLNGSKRPPLTLDQKRASLEKLINEHFLMWAGYQERADQAPGIVRLLDVTKGLLLRETLITQVVGSKAKTPAVYQRLYGQLRDRIFNQTDITVSDEAYNELKAALKLPEQGITSTQSNLLSEQGLNQLAPPMRQAVIDSIQRATQPSIPEKLTPVVRDHVFARCKIGFVTTGNVLDYYMQIPADKRPDLETHEGVNEILEQMLGNSLLTEEARARGLDKSPIVLEKMQLNRNMMVRTYVLDQIAGQAEARAKEPGEEARLKQWYQDHLEDRYTYKDANGKEQVIPFDPRHHERIEDDYIDDLREQMRQEYMGNLRKDHKIEINEKILAQIVL